jgi:hypothetical protein
MLPTLIVNARDRMMPDALSAYVWFVLALVVFLAL